MVRSSICRTVLSCIAFFDIAYAVLQSGVTHLAHLIAVLNN